MTSISVILHSLQCNNDNNDNNKNNDNNHNNYNDNKSFAFWFFYI